MDYILIHIDPISIKKRSLISLMAQTSTPQSFIITTKDKLSSLNVKNGQMIFVKDKGKIYYDWDNKRLAYHDIIELSTNSEREDLESPVNNKCYLVEEDHTLWQYRSDSWFKLTNEPNVVFAPSPLELPSIGGKENVLYIADKKLYIYNKELSSFEEIAKDNFVWGSF